MKKILLGVAAILLLASFLLAFKSKYLKTTPLSPITATLNGVDDKTAIAMIDNFAKNYDKDIGAKSVSAWYNVDQLKAINTLLMKEHKDQSIQTDGVRIYFGSDAPVSPGNTKLTNIKIFLVSTKPRIPLDPNKSDHIDYYNHSDDFLKTEIGIATDDNGDLVRNQGGSLFNQKPPLSGACYKPSTHFLPGGLAYIWTQARYEHGPKPDLSAYNTKSEWFSYCFINYILTVITDTNKSFTGLRIYLGKGFVDKKKRIRDVFILVPTYSVGQLNGDSYNCLEDLLSYPCKENEKLLKVDKFHRFPYTKDGGGYDEGELCPDVCN